MSTFALGGESPPSAPVPAPALSPASAAPRAAGGATGGTFAEVLAGLGNESARGEAQVSAALHAGARGRDLSATELLTLQARVYRYGEVVDLASRIIDRATTAVKTVIQGQ